jgi:hypothetical protein
MLQVQILGPRLWPELAAVNTAIVIAAATPWHAGDPPGRGCDFLLGVDTGILDKAFAGSVPQRRPERRVHSSDIIK